MPAAIKKPWRTWAIMANKPNTKNLPEFSEAGDMKQSPASLFEASIDLKKRGRSDSAPYMAPRRIVESSNRQINRGLI